MKITVNRARHALLTAVSWQDPAGLGLPFALAQDAADRTPGRAPEVRTAAAAAPTTAAKRAARRRALTVRG
ncbi:hypothetical protein [Streptomyces sp. NPDC050738]|uniref:hypothetical protein n=1 Tax=Streptomyces sp. NPDC050738 TaxID=3154744 RepID=UPI00342C69C9